MSTSVISYSQNAKIHRKALRQLVLGCGLGKCFCLTEIACKSVVLVHCVHSVSLQPYSVERQMVLKSSSSAARRVFKEVLRRSQSFQLYYPEMLMGSSLVSDFSVEYTIVRKKSIGYWGNVFLG